MRSLLMNHDCLLSYELMKVFHSAVFDSFDFFSSINSKQMQISPFSFFPLQRTCTLHYSLIGLLTHAKKFWTKIENYRPPPPSSHQSMLHRFHLRALCCCCCCNERTTKTTPVLKEQNCICRCLINNSIVRWYFLKEVLLPCLNDRSLLKCWSCAQINLIFFLIHLSSLFIHNNVILFPFFKHAFIKKIIFISMHWFDSNFFFFYCPMNRHHFRYDFLMIIMSFLISLTTKEWKFYKFKKKS